jgi:GntR family transcriptional regulator / MocR family aminotransferase
VTLHISLVGRRNLSVEIYRQVRDAIVTGTLRPGDRVPPSRELAAALDVSRMTVTIAYERLSAEGFVVSRVGDGTFVRPHLAQRQKAFGRREGGGALRARCEWQSIPMPTAFARPAVFDFRTGIPDRSLFPQTVWRRLLARTLRASCETVGPYGDPAGHPDLRAAIARHVGISRGVIVSPDDVTVTNGAQQALDITGRILLGQGDRIAVEDPGYVVPRRLFRALGSRVVGVPVDREGLVVDAIPRNVRAVYVTPSHQYPLGISMTLARRRSLLAWAERHDGAVIEDDYDSEFRFGDRPLEPLRTLDMAGRVIYVGSFSKTLLPALRLGFMIAPPSLRSAVQAAKFLSDWHSPTVLQLALAEFLETGGFGRHLRKLNVVYRERHQMLTTALATRFDAYLELMPSSTGLHVAGIARTASVDQIEAFARRAADAGVAIQTLSSFAAGEKALAGIVLGYGGIATADIEEGLRRLRKCFDR